jgi:hypothetical protein
MNLAILLSVVLAVAVPTSSPPPPRELPTIITVVSSPYCNSLADHFNGALLPMLANDRVLEETNVQLEDLNMVFHQLNYVQQFLHIRDSILREETTLNNSLATIQHHITQLREGAALTTDPKAQAEITQASWALSTAYDRQRQLSIDLQHLYQTMLNYPISRVNPALGGFDPREMAEPAAMRDVKSYLHFDNQRAVIGQSEDQAVDIAYNAAQTYCVPKK